MDRYYAIIYDSPFLPTKTNLSSPILPFVGVVAAEHYMNIHKYMFLRPQNQRFIFPKERETERNQQSSSSHTMPH